MKNLLRVGLVLSLALGLFNVAQAGPGPAPVGPGVLAESLVVPDSLSPEVVQRAILVAGVGRGWTIKDKTDGKVVLFLEHGGWRSTLTIAYDGRLVNIFSNSAKLNRNGVPKKYAVPENWVKYIKQDINAQLAIAMLDR